MSAAEVVGALPWRETRLRVQYVVDEEGERVSALLPIEDYEMLLDHLEDLYDIRAYENAKAEDALLGGESMPAEQLFAEIERERGWHIA